MVERTADEVIGQLRSLGVRITTTRRAVLDVLVAMGSHVTAEDLHARVRDRHPDVSHSSIYRTMDLLAELGIVVHVHLGHGPAEYHLADDVHAHLVCSGCGAVAEIEPALSDSFADVVADRFGFALDLRHFALTGRCRDCQPRSSAP